MIALGLAGSLFLPARAQAGEAAVGDAGAETLRVGIAAMTRRVGALVAHGAMPSRPRPRVALRDERVEAAVSSARAGSASAVADRAHGWQFGLRARSSLANSSGPDGGVMVGFAVSDAGFSLALRLAYWHAGFREGEVLYRVEASTEEFGAEARLGKPWPIRRIVLEPFIALGGGVMWQHFAAIRQAPARTSAAGHVDACAAIRREFADRRYVLLEGALEGYWFRRRSEGAHVALSPSLGVAVTAGFGWWL